MNPADLASRELNGPGVTDEQLRHVGRLTGLTELAVESANISEASLGILSGLPNLRTLSLEGTRLQPGAEKRLTGLSQLQSLDIRGTGLPGSSIDTLEKALPNCKVRSR